MTFRNISLGVSALFLMLCLTLLLLPQLVYWLFALQENDLGNFLAKRAGVLFLGLALLCFLARNSMNIEVHQLVSASVGVAMGGMALLGVYELAHGNVGAGILLAIGVETAIATLFAMIWRARQQTRSTEI